jgi:hypothetical protein
VVTRIALTFRLDSQVIVDLTRAPQAFQYIGPDDFERPVLHRGAPPGGTWPRRPGYGLGPGYGPGPYAILATTPYGWGYPYTFGPTFGVGVVVRGGGWGWGRRPGWGWRR